jgi:uncharacterized protein (AIM24 family)
VADSYVQHLTRGGELLRSDRVEEARAELEAARAIKPNDPKGLSLLGLVYFRLGRFEEAKAIYADLVVKAPKDASLALNLGLVHLKLGDTKKAIDALVQARDLDPGQARTVGYLGLAYARDGQYANAREAFLAAGQEELAREMEQYLGPEEKKPPAPPPPPPEAIAKSDGAVAQQIERKDVSVVKPPPLAPVPAATPPPAAPKASKAEAAPEAPIERMAGEGVVSAAVRIAELPAPARAEYNADSSVAPQPLGQFAAKRLIRPDDGDLPFELGAGDTLIVRVRGRCLSRTEGVVVSGGELSYEPATKRVRGRTTEEPFGSDARPMFQVSGHGHLVASNRGQKFIAVELADDVLYLREELVFAFEERLRWENGHIPGSSGNVPVVQFRGEGCVAMRVKTPPLTVKLLPDKVIYVEADLLDGWIGRVVPRIVAPAAGGDASAPFVECSGEGILLVEEPPLPDVKAAAAGEPKES